MTPAAKREPRNPSAKAKASPEPAAPPEPEDISAELSYREAQAALQLCMAQLQSSDLDIEAMSGLYERAQSYANRCESLLDQIEQEVMQWDPEQPDASPRPYASATKP